LAFGRRYRCSGFATCSEAACINVKYSKAAQGLWHDLQSWVICLLLMQTSLAVVLGLAVHMKGLLTEISGILRGVYNHLLPLSL
jgi:hypothetical protein